MAGDETRGCRNRVEGVRRVAKTGDDGEAGFVDVTKSFEQNRPQTFCRITPQGRARYLEYLAVLEQVVRDAAAAVKADDASPAGLPGLAPA